MCIAIPGKILEINDQEALIEYPSEKRKALIGGENVNIGDFVMVQMGIIVKIIPQEQAQKAMDIWSKYS